MVPKQAQVRANRKAIRNRSPTAHPRPNRRSRPNRRREVRPQMRHRRKKLNLKARALNKRSLKINKANKKSLHQNRHRRNRAHSRGKSRKAKRGMGQNRKASPPKRLKGPVRNLNRAVCHQIRKRMETNPAKRRRARRHRIKVKNRIRTGRNLATILKPASQMARASRRN